MIFFVLDRVENIMGKRENAGYWHFLNFAQCSQKASFSGLLKVGIVWKRVKLVKLKCGRLWYVSLENKSHIRDFEIKSQVELHKPMELPTSWHECWLGFQ